MQAVNHSEWSEAMKGPQSQSREKIQEKISEITRTVPRAGSLGRRASEARPQQLFINSQPSPSQLWSTEELFPPQILGSEKE